MATRASVIEQHTTAGGASIHLIYLSRRREDGIIVQERYWGPFGMRRDMEFVHPRVEIEVRQPLFPQVAFGLLTEKEIARQARRRRCAECRERERRVAEKREAFLTV